MKDIIIVCAGSTAIEVFTLIETINQYAVNKGENKKYNLLGFIEDNVNVSLPAFVHVPILGNIKDWVPTGNEVYAMGNADPKTKEKIATLLKSRGCIFETLILPYGHVKPYVKIGEGCIITSYAINNGAQIGDFVNIMGSMIGGHAIIGDYSTTLGFANIPNSTIGKRVYIGSHAVVLGPSVGDDAEVCVGSIVINKVKAGTKVFGNPAKRVDW